MKIKTLLVVILAQCLASVGFAQKIPDAEMAKAAAIENSVQRLAAYDAIAAKHKLTKDTNASAVSAGNWMIREDVSPIDDSRTVIGILDADSPSKIGYRSVTPALVIRYAEKKLSAYIRYDAFIGTDAAEVTIRYGKDEPMTLDWNVSTDHKAIFAPNEGAYFLSRIKEVPSIVVRVTPYGENPVTNSFTMAGVEAVMAKINEAKQASSGAAK
jgi:type VI secretion system protein VasI